MRLQTLAAGGSATNSSTVSGRAWESPGARSKRNGFAGCVHGYCYCREQKYYPYEDPHDFAYRIQVKENAPDLLRRALSRAPVDLVGTGDYQPAERKYGLSRKMLEVCLDLGFPFLCWSGRRWSCATWTCCRLSTNGPPRWWRSASSRRPTRQATSKFARWSGWRRRRRNVLRRWSRLPGPGILTGTCMMPILPELCDDEANLRERRQLDGRAWRAIRAGQWPDPGGPATRVLFWSSGRALS